MSTHRPERAAATQKQVAQPAVAPPSVEPRSVALQRALGNQVVQHAGAPGGVPVPAAVRVKMELQLGYDFTNVRIHDDVDANQSAGRLDAVAFTAGNDIVLGADAPPLTGEAGVALLAHELAHVAQQRNATRIVDAVSAPGDASELAANAEAHGASSVSVGGPVPAIQRQVAVAGQPALVKHQEGTGQLIKAVTIGGRTYTYLIWGLWQRGDDLQKFRSRVLTKWVAWRFAGITAAQRDTVITYLQTSPFVPFDTGALKPDSNYSLPLQDGVLKQARMLSGEASREQPHQDQPGESGEARTSVEQSPGGVGSHDPKSETTPRAGEIGDPRGERDIQVKGSPDALAGNPALARLYLNVLQRYGGVKADVTQAERGLTRDQIGTIIAGNSRAQVVSDVFTQGWVEYGAAGNDDVTTFGFIEEALLTQRDRGNFTALHNQLEIAQDREGLGLYKRGTIVRYYDSSGLPVPTNVGGYRDPGFRAAAPPAHAAQIPITDRGLLSVLGGIKNVTLDDNLQIYQSAKGYYDNGDLLLPAVRDGWDGWKALATEFKEQLGGVIFFLGLEGIATVLKKLQDPKAQGAGLLLEEFLKKAGKFFNFVFGAELALLLFDCGLELSKVQREQGSTTLDGLSQQHLERAAVQMRRLVTMMLAAGLTAATLAAARKGAVTLDPPKGGGLALAPAGGSGVGPPQVAAGAVPSVPAYRPPFGIPKRPSQLESGGSGSGRREDAGKATDRPAQAEGADREAPAKASDRAAPAKAVRERARERLATLLEDRGRTQATIDRLENELFTARSEVNRLRKQALAADRGSAGYAETASKLREAEAALREIQEVDELGGYRDERTRQNKAEEAILESLALQRPRLLRTTTDVIRKAAKRNATGQFLDANTGEVIVDEPVYGHKWGYEHRRLVLEATKRGMSQEQFGRWVNEHPEWFQLETKANNESHRFEKPGVD